MKDPAVCFCRRCDRKVVPGFRCCDYHMTLCGPLGVYYVRAVQGLALSDPEYVARVRCMEAVVYLFVGMKEGCLSSGDVTHVLVRALPPVGRVWLCSTETPPSAEAKAKKPRKTKTK